MFRNVTNKMFNSGKMKIAMKFSLPLLFGTILLSKTFTKFSQTAYCEVEEKKQKKKIKPKPKSNEIDSDVQRDNEKRQIIYKFVLTG